ncbi:unnamed protein product [Prunus armeniaca]
MNIQDGFLICQKKPSRWFFNLRHTLPFGIGLHHAGLNKEDRSLVEELFANNKIQAFLFYLSHHLVIIKVPYGVHDIYPPEGSRERADDDAGQSSSMFFPLILVAPIWFNFYFCPVARIDT